MTQAYIYPASLPKNTSSLYKSKEQNTQKDAGGNKKQKESKEQNHPQKFKNPKKAAQENTWKGRRQGKKGRKEERKQREDT